MPKITKRLIENAEVKDKDYIIFDSDIPGFGARILPSGRRSYLVQYRVGRSYRRISLGMHGVLTTDQARGEAIKVLGRVKSGEDPSAARKQARLEMTVSELCERMIEEHAVPHCKPSTVVGYRFYTKAYIKKPIGQIRVSQIQRADIAKFHHALRHKPYQANRCIQFLSKAFNLAEVWGLRADGTNPCRHIKKYKEPKRERYLSKDELARLGEVLRQCESEQLETQSAVNALRLLLFTGCRLSEIIRRKDSLPWRPCPASSRRHQTRRRQPVGHHRRQTRRPSDRPPTSLAAHPQARWYRGRSHPRPASYLCLGRCRRWLRPANDRQTPRSHPGPDNCPLRSPGR